MHSRKAASASDRGRVTHYRRRLIFAERAACMRSVDFCDPHARHVRILTSAHSPAHSMRPDIARRGRTLSRAPATPLAPKNSLETSRRIDETTALSSAIQSKLSTFLGGLSAVVALHECTFICESANELLDPLVHPPPSPPSRPSPLTRPQGSPLSLFRHPLIAHGSFFLSPLLENE